MPAPASRAIRGMAGGAGYAPPADLTPPLPPGVTLRAIDGGAAYYAANGFTDAVSGGWDDLSFFPVASDYSFYPSHDPAVFQSLGLNFSTRVTSDASLPALRAAGIAVVNGGDTVTGLGSETVGWNIDEPGDWATITGAAATFAGYGGTGRFLHVNFTWNQFVYGGIGDPCGGSDDQMTDTVSCETGMPASLPHINLVSADIYWFAGSTGDALPHQCALIYGLGSDATADQMARGSNYGDMIDQMRGWLITYPAPCGAYIETEDALFGPPDREILPQEWNWAVWSQIVHGARWILNFGTTSNFGSQATFGFSETVLSGASVSMFDQATATNALIADLAPVINSPFALGYASVTPAGYTFPVAHLVLDNGIEVMAKYYTGGTYSNSAGTFHNGFYVFACVRGSAAQTGITATFTTTGGYSGPVTVMNESRTVTASGGVFTDTFATAYDVHIYQMGG